MQCAAGANVRDYGYDDIGGFFGKYSEVISKNVKYTYISKLMMKKAMENFIEDSGLRVINDKIDFIRTVYVAVPVMDSADDAATDRLCAADIVLLPQEAKRRGYEDVMVLNEANCRTKILLKRGEGGLNTILITIVAYSNSGEILKAYANLIGGVFSLEEVIPLMNI